MQSLEVRMQKWPDKLVFASAFYILTSAFCILVNDWRAEHCPLDLLQPLHIVHAWNLAHPGNNIFQVLEIGDVEHDINVRLPVIGPGFNVADVGFAIADDSRNLLEHAETVVAKNRELHWICARRPIIARPFHFNLPLRLVHQCYHVRTVRRVDRHAFAASYVTHHILAADRVTTSRSVDQQIAMALYPDGLVVVICAKQSPQYAGSAAGSLVLCFSPRLTSTRLKGR